MGLEVWYVAWQYVQSPVANSVLQEVRSTAALGLLETRIQQFKKAKQASRLKSGTRKCLAAERRTSIRASGMSLTHSIRIP